MKATGSGSHRAGQRRGVLMTASSRPASSRLPAARPGSWKAELPEVGQVDDGEDSDAGREASRLEWEQLERGVEQDRQKRRSAEDFASGRRAGVVAYDDVAAEEAGEDSGDGGAEPSAAAGAATAAIAPAVAVPVSVLVAAAPSASSSSSAAVETRGIPELRPERALPLEEHGGGGGGGKRRGGLKSGSKKRDRALLLTGGDDGDQPPASTERRHKKRKEDEDPERWVKLQLEGDTKAKRIDATRIVHYHDFDARGTTVSQHREQAEKGDDGGRDFRSRLSVDLYGEDDEDEAS